MSRIAQRITSTVAKKFRYSAVVRIPSPPLEERVRERRPFVSRFLCHNTTTVVRSASLPLPVPQSGKRGEGRGEGLVSVELENAENHHSTVAVASATIIP